MKTAIGQLKIETLMEATKKRYEQKQGYLSGKENVLHMSYHRH